MIEFNDKRWEGLTGGYRQPYDPRPALTRIEAQVQSNEAWKELWNELHHQGDVGDASYAAVPHLVRIQARSQSVHWNPYALISTIDIERHRKGNPPMPAWLCESYRHAWREVLDIGARDLRRTDDSLTVRAIVAALALAKGCPKLGVLIAYIDSSDLDEFLEQRYAWAELYSEPDAGGDGGLAGS